MWFKSREEASDSQKLENYIIYYRHKNIIMIYKILQLFHGSRINLFFIKISYKNFFLKIKYLVLV
jgi:hypothetical protein